MKKKKPVAEKPVKKKIVVVPAVVAPVPELVKPVPIRVPTPEPKFILLRSEKLDENIVEDMYAMDLPSNGCIVRTIWTGARDGQFINATMFHVPNMGIRDGRLIRSLI